MSIHITECIHSDMVEYHLRYPGLTKQEAHRIADRINAGWQGLTDEEIDEAHETTISFHGFARAIEAKLKEKNA